MGCAGAYCTHPELLASCSGTLALYCFLLGCRHFSGVLLRSVGVSCFALLGAAPGPIVGVARFSMSVIA